MSLNNNQLTEKIPPELGNLSSLEVLLLNSNQLSGTVPTELCNLTNLEKLQLNDNNLEGFYPDCICSECVQYQCHIDDWNALRQLYLSTAGDNWNNKTGWQEVTGNARSANCNLDSLYGVTLDEGRVQFLNLSGNQLSGSIPAELGNLTNLTELYLSANQLSGSIPAELGNLTNLFWLYLNDNQLSDSIPAELGNLTKLDLFFLARNQFSGSLPPELCNLTNVSIFHINNNNFVGCYPACMRSFCSRLAYFNTDYGISDGNNFNANWIDFCALGVDACTNCTPPAVGIIECPE